MVGRQTPELWLEAGELTARAAELSRELKRPVKPGVEVLVAKTTSQAPEQRDWTFRHRDGHHFRARLEVAALRNALGEVTGFVGTAYDLNRLMIVADERDITDERLMNRQLQRVADDLSQQVEHRTAELVASSCAWLMRLRCITMKSMTAVVIRTD